MCGIAGAMNTGDTELLQRMNICQKHRGPDDAGIWEQQLADSGWIGLASRRLAILDLSPAGHMPMSTSDGKITITYNGEIYNHLQLRKELEVKGYRFRSGSDTETILYLYQEYGPECVSRLNGMFVLAIWDVERQHLFLARDHFGIKPLYYHHNGRKLVFASELKSLLEHSEIPRHIDYEALNQFMTLLWVPDPRTMLKDIYKFPAGHFAIFRSGELTFTQYWDLKMPASDHVFQSEEEDLKTELRQRFIKTVKAQMLSDVPLGAFLSAGMDSSSIVAAMAHGNSDPIRTYTIAFSKKYNRSSIALDDTDVARRTSEHFGCHHTEIIVEPNVVDLLPKLIWHMDEPVADPALITAFLVNQEARKTVKVLLSGVGGDELFAGYRKHQAHYLAQNYSLIPKLLRKNLIEPALMALPSFQNTFLRGYVRLAKKMARSGSLPSHERFLMDSVYLTEAQKQNLYLPRIASKVDRYDAFSEHREHYKKVSHADFLNQMLYLDSKTFMVSLNLNYNDKMSMASSVEVRVPFLDWELAEWVAWNVPPRLKLRGGVTKHIFREAMRPMLPDEVLTQKKAGFGAPVSDWISHELTEMIQDVLSLDRINARGIFDPIAVQKLIHEHKNGQQDWSMQIWQLLTFELWQQQFLD